MKKLYIILIFIYLCVYLLPLGVRPILIPDESRYAEISREMIETGDFIVPRLNGLRYFEKPVLGYWLNAASIMVFGENAFAIRLASALAAGLTALMLFFTARRFSGGGVAGLLSATVYLSCAGVFGIGVFCVLDSMFAFFVTGAMVCFFYSVSTPADSRRKTAFLISCGIFTGLAFLTKGFLAFAIPVVAIVPFLIWEKRVKDIFLLPWIPLIAAALVILPWAVMIHAREPDFWNYFFWDEHIRRFAAQNAQHKEPFLYYIIRFPGVVIPWTFVLPTAWLGMKKMKPLPPIIRFSFCWFFFPFLFFTLSKGKILTYILPCLAPFALLVAAGLFYWLDRKKDRAAVLSFTVGAVLAAIVFAVLATGVMVLQITDINHLRPYAFPWKYGAAVFALFICSLFMWFAAKAGNMGKKMAIYAIAPVFVMLVAPFAFPDSVIPDRAPGGFLLKQADRIGQDTIIVSDQSPAKAVCWFYKRHDIYLLESSGELSYGLEYPDAEYRRLDMKNFCRLIEKNPGRIALVARVNNFKKWKSHLPAPGYSDTNGRFIFAVF